MTPITVPPTAIRGLKSCGEQDCDRLHIHAGWVERERDLSPLARRIAAIQPVPEAPDRRPAWLARLTAKELSSGRPA